MTQYEIAKKYGVPQCDVSVAIKYIGDVKATGKKENPLTGYMINIYEEQEVASALCRLYIDRSDRHLEKAQGWTDKANRILSLRRDNNDGQTV